MDSSRFETLLFFDEIHDRATAERLALVADESHSFAGLATGVSVKLIESRHTDILLDLGWHAHLPGLLIFAQRAASVQINFSQPSRSSALPNMDYVISNVRDTGPFTERTLHLPDAESAAGQARQFGELLLGAWQQSGGMLETNA